MSSDNTNIRHRFTVPSADVQVNKWIESQSNLGFSIRVLIKNFVREYGYQDATCLEFGTPVARRGRPPKDLKRQMSELSDSEPIQNVQESAVPQTEPQLEKQETMHVPVQTEPKFEPADIESLFNTTAQTTSDNDGLVDPESLLK